MLDIAVIIANRNNALFLEQCVRSALDQTLKPAQVIVVDDASSDASADLLCDLALKHGVRVMRNSSRRGVAAARQLALEAARAPFVTTLDSDDFYAAPDKLERESAVLLERRAQTLAFSDVLRVDRHAIPLGLVSESRRIRQGDLSSYIRNLRGFIPRDYLAARSDLLAVGGYREHLRMYEDWDLKIRLSQRCAWYFAGGVGTAYRDNPDGLSKAPFSDHLSAMRSVFWDNCQSRSRIGRNLEFANFVFWQSVYCRRPAVWP
jgi:glycosyltransferase involved in cell wall biosynthesis